MILVDTSLWIDHLRAADAELVTRLGDDVVLGHPWVVGELALGNLANRGEVLRLLNSLPMATVAAPDETLSFIGGHQLAGAGIGYVDVQLLASSRLTGARLWTRDRRLAAVADRLGVGYSSRPSM